MYTLPFLGNTENAMLLSNSIPGGGHMLRLIFCTETREEGTNGWVFIYLVKMFGC